MHIPLQIHGKLVGHIDITPANAKKLNGLTHIAVVGTKLVNLTTKPDSTKLIKTWRATCIIEGHTVDVIATAMPSPDHTNR